MAWIVPVVSAVAGAYAANKQASAANKSKSGWTDQTSEQSPYMEQNLLPGLNAAINRQSQLFDMIPQIGPGGKVYYTSPIGGASEVPQNGPRTNAGPKASGTFGPIDDYDPGSAAAQPSAANMTPKQQKQYAAEMKRQAGAKAAKNGGGKGGATTSGTPGPKGPATTPQGMFQDIYAQGMGGPSQTVKTGDTAMQNILGAAGGHPAAGGETTGFEGYNPILDYQAGQMMGEDTNHSDLLMKFLGGQYGQSGGGSGGSGGGDGGGGRYASGLSQPSYNPNGGGGGGNAGGGQVPDTMRGPGWFQDHVNEMWGQGPDPELQTLIDAYAADAQKAGYKTQAGAQAAAAGAGRLGGGAYNASMRQVAEDTTRDIGTQSAQIRVGDRAQQKAIQQHLLDQVNARDLGAMQDATQRYGISESSASSAAASGAAAASASRGQDLQAILGMMSYDTDQRKLLSGIGSELSQNRISTLGLIPGQEDARYAGTDRALGAAGAYGQWDASRHAADASASVARAGLNQQAGMFNAGQQQSAIDSYLRTLGMVGGMGGSSHTWGTNVQPGAGVSVGGATAAGAIGGALAGWGAYNQYKK